MSLFGFILFLTTRVSAMKIFKGFTEKDMIDSQEWEKKFIYHVAHSYVREQRRRYRWGLFFKFIIIFYISSLSLLAYFDPGNESFVDTEKSHVGLVKLTGEISAESRASADKMMTSLKDAFENEYSKAIILRADSPGGSPVQSGYIYDEIVRLRKEYPDKKLYTVMVDLCASGCYYVAAASDEIYADKATLVGSIGVRMGSFGFVDTLKMLGVERRVLTAGKHKTLYDPFSPVNEAGREHLEKNILDVTHRQFITAVKNGRRDRLSDNEDIFSGLVWTGEDGVRLGLIDGLGDSHFVARKVIGIEEIVDYTQSPSYKELLVKRMGVGISELFDLLMGVKLF